MYLLIIVCALIAFLFHKHLIKPHSYWKNRNVVHVKPTFLFGSLAENVLQKLSFCDLLDNIYNQFPKSKYFGIYRFQVPILILKDTELIKKIGIKDFDNFVDHQNLLSEDIDPLWGKNLFASRGEKWRHMRPVLSPSFTSSKMKAMFTLVSECADQFMNHFLAKKEEIITIEIKDIFTRYTNDVIATCAFGIQCNSLDEPENEFYLFGKEAADFGNKRFTFILYGISPLLAKLFDVKIFGAKTAAFFRNLTRSTVKIREEQKIVRPDMINQLMEARKGRLQHDDGNKIQETGFATAKESDIGKTPVGRIPEITDDDITAQALIFFVAGFDTSSTLMSYIAYELAINKDIQDKLLIEVDETLHRCNGKLTYEALHKMKYLDMVISETLRKWPPMPLSDRVCEKDYPLERDNKNDSPLIIEKGTLVGFPIYSLHRDAQYYPEPEKFDPERFSDENKDKINAGAYIPFGIGPRNCIGSRFALMENKCIIFHILTKFEIVPVRKSVIPVVLSTKHFNMTAEGGMWLGFKKRNL